MTMLLGDVFKNSTFKLFMLLLSAGLLIIGMVGLLFSIFLYPTLVPYYGGGERFLILDNSVEYPYILSLSYVLKFLQTLQ